MKILSWNIRQGGGRRLEAIVDAIAGQGPDLVVVNELRARTAPALVDALHARGLAFHEHTSPSKSENGTLVASRSPLRRQPPRMRTKRFHHGFLEVDVAGWATVGAVYGPLGREPTRAFWNRLARHTATRVNEPYLLIGDFNTGESRVDAYRPMAGSDHLLAIRAAGFVDLWRARNAVMEYTWFSFGRGGVPLNGFRIDHAYASTPLANHAGRCYYSHAEREARLSDHSMLVVEFTELLSHAP